MLHVMIEVGVRWVSRISLVMMWDVVLLVVHVMLAQLVVAVN